MNEKLLLTLALLIVPCMLFVAPVNAQTDGDEINIKTMGYARNGTILLPNASMSGFGTFGYHSIAEKDYTWEYATVNMTTLFDTNSSIVVEAYQHLQSEEHGGYYVPIGNWNVSDIINLNNTDFGLEDWVSNGRYMNGTSWERNGTHEIVERYRRHQVRTPYILFLIYNLGNTTAEIYFEDEYNLTLHNIGPAIEPDVEITPWQPYDNSSNVVYAPSPIPPNNLEFEFYNILLGFVIFALGILLGAGWVFLTSRKLIEIEKGDQ